ncbi:MAG: hypothetical protein RSE04_06000 [Hydrogenoanaerobacterium sp.]
MKNTNFTLDKGFKQWQNWIKTVDKQRLPALRNSMANETAARGFEYASAYAGHKATGRLSQSLAVKATEHYLNIQLSDNGFIVVYGTCVPYAEAVEEGYNQLNRVSSATGKKPSLFVPGYWSGGTFRYQPGFKTGMVLTGRIVEGKHYMQKSLDDLKGDLDKIALIELRKLWASLNG